MTLRSRAFRHSPRVQKASTNAPPFRQPEVSHGVALLQAGLIRVGFNMPISTAKKGVPDGIFGDETTATVKAFQEREKLTADGIAGHDTITRLDELLAAKDPPSRPRPPRPVPPKPAPPAPKPPGPPKPNPAPPPAPKPPAPTPPPAPFRPPEDPEFKVGTDDPPTSHDPGAGPWNSESKEISTRVLHSLMFESTFLSGATIVIGDDAVTHLLHYNRNTGKPLEIDLAGMIEEVPSANDLYKTLAAKMQVYIEKFPVGTWDITSKKLWGGYNLKSESKNWFFAVGGYSAWIKGRVTITESGGKKNFSVDGKYRFYDRYNWDGGKSVTIGPVTITDETMGEFHRQGMSMEYDELGTAGVKFSWVEGTAIPPSQLAPVGSR